MSSKRLASSRYGVGGIPPCRIGIGCVECHTANEGEIDAWKHEGTYVSALVTPMDMFHLKQDDRDDRVKGVLTVGEFYEKTDDAKVIFT